MTGGMRRASWVRVAPFALFMLLLGLRGAAADLAPAAFDARWLYAVTVVAVGGLLWWWRHEYVELARGARPGWREGLEAVAVGLAVLVAWVHLDASWMQLGSPTAAYNALDEAGRVDWRWVAVRWVGAALVVPVMEELFWRSYLMRWFDQPQFERVAPQAASLKAVVLSTFMFMLVHPQWLAAIVAGLAYAWLYRRQGRLWTAVIAHSVTNGVLGAWVIGTGRWQFW